MPKPLDGREPDAPPSADTIDPDAILSETRAAVARCRALVDAAGRRNPSSRPPPPVPAPVAPPPHAVDTDLARVACDLAAIGARLERAALEMRARRAAMAAVQDAEDEPPALASTPRREG